MLLLVSTLTFLATVIVLLAIGYAFTPGEISVADRLGRLWRPPAETQERRFRDKQRDRVQHLLVGVGKRLPGPTQQRSRTGRLLVRAGYRNPEALLALRGAQVLLMGGLLGVVYLFKLYLVNPIFLTVLPLVLGFFLPELWLTRAVNRRQHRLRLSLPDALDLLVICVEAGLGLDQAILRVAQELHITHPELSEEFRLVNAEMRVGKTRLEALRELGDRTGVDDIRSLVAMLIQTDRFGTSVAQSLKVHSDDLRLKRRQRAEEAAAKTTVKMVPPLVFFIFPALVVVILGPAVISIVRQLLPALR